MLHNSLMVQLKPKSRLSMLRQRSLFFGLNLGAPETPAMILFGGTAESLFSPLDLPKKKKEEKWR